MNVQQTENGNLGDGENCGSWMNDGDENGYGPLGDGSWVDDDGLDYRKYGNGGCYDGFPGGLDYALANEDA